MALILTDRVQENCTSPGTGSVTLLGAVNGYQTFLSGIGNGNTTYYTIADVNGANWEVGLGTYSSSGNSLARTTILASSNGGSIVNFSSGNQFVWGDYPARKALYLDPNNITNTVGAVQFDTSYVATLAAGQVGWDGNNTLGLGMFGGNVIQHIGEDQYFYIKASSAITKGQVCMFTGAVGASGVLTAAPATGTTLDGLYVMGIAAESIALNGFGLIQCAGTLKGIDTSGFTAGSILYYDPTSTGGYTATQPNKAYTQVVVAATANSTNNGTLAIRVTYLPEVSDLAGMSITSSSNGQIFSYDGGNGYYKNTTLTAGTGISVSSSANGVLTITNTSPSSGGTVTSVSGTTGRITSTGGTTPVIDLASGIVTAGTTGSSSLIPVITVDTYGRVTTITTASNPQGTVTSVGGTGTVNGLTLTGTVTTSGSLTLGGTLDLSSPPAIGGTTPNTGAFTSVTTPSVTASATDLTLSAISTGAVKFQTLGGLQGQFSNTASAVNYVQVTGSATGNATTVSAQGSDSNIFLQFFSKGTSGFNFYSGNGSYRQLRIDGSVNAVNFFGIAGSTAGQTPILSAASQSSDTNISMAFQPKGTGAIDLAAGSSGVNISNGNTVTAVTRTAAGTGYTTPPTWTATAPTTAGGATASGSVNSIGVVSAVVSAGGSGYVVGDVLTISGGTQTTAATVTVATLSGSAVATVSISNAGVYTASPTNPASTTGGTGTGATFTLSFGINNSFTITAGSGYIEQPTVSFSGGGGSGAAAYATVGSGTIVKTLGANLDFYTPNQQIAFRVQDFSGSVATGYWTAFGGNISPILRAVGTGSGQIQTNGATPIQIQTNNGVTQCAFAHTANAVNYVQVTGAATTAAPVISAQGSDTNINLAVTAKGTGVVNITNATRLSFGSTNYIQVAGAATTVAPAISALGGDTNINLALTPKGTGTVQFGTFTSSVGITSTGYITITDSGGTTRRLLVG